MNEFGELEKSGLFTFFSQWGHLLGVLQEQKSGWIRPRYGAIQVVDRRSLEGPVAEFGD